MNYIALSILTLTWLLENEKIYIKKIHKNTYKNKRHMENWRYSFLLNGGPEILSGNLMENLDQS